MDAECEIAVGIELESRCVSCGYQRSVDQNAKLILDESSSSENGVKASVVVATPDACECGERRVRVVVELGM